MALRILLADESPTIRKVIQLALQDLGAIVKAVPVGTEVVDSAKQFQPEIMLIDVLLPKKNGYELVEEIRKTPELENVPIVLMWSGFVRFDEERFLRSGATAKLEKPFDPDQLRQIVIKLVPRLQTNELAPWVKIEMPGFIEDRPATKQEASEWKTTESQEMPLATTNFVQSLNLGSEEKVEPPTSPKPIVSETALSSIEERIPETGVLVKPIHFSNDLEEEEFQQVPLYRRKTQPDDNKEKKTETQIQPGNDSSTAPKKSEEPTVVTMNWEEVSLAASPSSTWFSGKPISDIIDRERVEQILQVQIREVIKDLAWNIIPDLTERIVREEIQKLLKEAEKLP